jgi:hypothetical protein
MPKKLRRSIVIEILDLRLKSGKRTEDFIDELDRLLTKYADKEWNYDWEEVESG